ncbi:MAG: hypothetical protein ABH846_02200 [Patescibacteria group bacterium]
MLENIQLFLQTTPIEQLMAYGLLIIAPFPIMGILIWGFSEVWIDHRQDLYWEKLKWHLLHISVPADSIQTPMGMANFFTNLAGSKSAITWKEKWLDGKFQAYFTLEITSDEGRINFYIRTQAKYRDMVEASLYAQYPEAQISEVEDYVQSLPNEYPSDEYDLFGSEMILSKENYFPIKTWDMFEHQGEKDLRFKDPMLPVLENLGKLKTGEHYWLQILIIQPDEQDWRKDGTKFLWKLLGKEEKKKPSKSIFGPLGWIPQEIAEQALGMFAGEAEAPKKDNDWAAFKITPEEKEQMEGVARKIGSLGWWSKIRWVYCAKHEVFRKGSMAAMTKGIFHQFKHQSMNSLGLHNASTPKDDYFFQEWQMPMKQRRLMKRYQNRSFSPGSTPYILNCEELATLFHFPPADARTPVMTSVASRMAEPPLELQFAAEGEPDLPNLERTQNDFAGVQAAAATVPEKPAPLTVPRPASLTGSPIPREEVVRQPVGQVAAPAQEQYDPSMPRPGMPAPLPPGLDLADEPINPESNSPNNLPT